MLCSPKSRSKFCFPKMLDAVPTVASGPRSLFHALLRGPELADRVRQRGDFVRPDLPCRRVARIQNRRACSRASSLRRSGGLLKAQLRERRNKAQRHSKHRQQVMLSPAARAAGGVEKGTRHRNNGTPTIRHR
jgi:hypothetical protein